VPPAKSAGLSPNQIQALGFHPEDSMMRTSIAVSMSVSTFLICWMSATATAQNAQSSAQAGSNNNRGPGFTSDPLDPVVELQRIQARRVFSTTRNSLFRTSPLTPLRECWLQAEKNVTEATDIKFATAVNHLFQELSESFPDQDQFGMSTNMTFVGTWEAFNKGEPDQGEVTFGIDGRWGYGQAYPTDLGPNSLGFTANPYGKYNPTFIVRNLFWRQGSREAGWMYRVGHVTPDQFLSTSAHINPNATYLPIAGTGGFSMGLPDSGLGMAAGVFVNDRINVAAIVSDADANRFDFGEVGPGNLFDGAELQVKVCPLTENAGYSKITLWHNDGTEDGEPLNGSTGKEGWGMFFKCEQELSCDGRAIAIGRWGKAFNESALYNQLAGAHFLLYDPFGSGEYTPKDLIHAPVVGAAYNWVEPSAPDSRDESNIELFYRFPLFPMTDMSLSYQSIINPALDPNNDSASVLSIRFRSTF
jgi:porin